MRGRRNGNIVFKEHCEFIRVVTHSLPFSSSLGWQFDFRISSASEGGASHVFLLLNHDDDCDVWNGLQFKSDRQGNGPVYVGRSPGDQSGLDRDGERD